MQKLPDKIKKQEIKHDQKQIEPEIRTNMEQNDIKQLKFEFELLKIENIELRNEINGLHDHVSALINRYSTLSVAFKKY